MFSVRRLAKQILELAGVEVRRMRGPRAAAREVRTYLDSGRVPWSRGYLEYRTQLVTAILDTPSVMTAFRLRQPLPPGQAAGVDERTVEYPWLFATLSADPGPRLDAGSTLNHRFIVERPDFRAKDWTFATLAPEPDCYWQLGVSYSFCDLRKLPFRDGHFCEVACISTIEHVGMDNSGYTSDPADRQCNTDDYLLAVAELRRVLRPGGRLLLTVPFGRYENLGWSQQFDAAMLDRLMDCFGPSSAEATYYRYRADGWQMATREQCADATYSRYGAELNLPPEKRSARHPDPDRAAAARAVACVVLVKPLS